MKPEAFFGFAENLLPTTEAPAIRSCISRAYYAAFHTINEVQIKLKALPTRNHEVVSIRFFNSSTPEIKDLGISLDHLRASRHRADYRLKDREIEEADEAENAIIQARWLIEATREYYSDSSLRERMREAIKADRALRGY